MIPIMSSCSLLLMFHLFSYVSQLFTAFIVVASASSIFFYLSPYVMYLKLQLGLLDPFVSRCWSKSFTHIQGLLLLLCSGIVAASLVSGHWILNNLLGISICIAFVSYDRLQNIRICLMLLVCLFVHDMFWVFFSEIFFGANVMVSVAAQQASNFVRTVANNLSLPRLQLITNKLKLSMKIVFSRNLFGGVVPNGNFADFMMHGLGDMAITAMFLALVFYFNYRKSRDSVSPLDIPSAKEHKYIWYTLSGYAIRFVTALPAGVLTQHQQNLPLCTPGPYSCMTTFGMQSQRPHFIFIYLFKIFIF